MSDLEIRQFMCLNDNFGVLVYDPASEATLAVDVPDAETVDGELEKAGWTLSHILITHHHADHVQGLKALKDKTGAQVIGPVKSAAQIGDIDESVDDGATVSFGDYEIRCIATPGHTLDQISYWIPEGGVAFTGDTLFAMGCGRLFESSPAIMWSSMQKLMNQLPPETRIYCGHEYTFANARFAVSVDPANSALADRLVEVERLRAADKPTLPTTMALELQTNPFLRVEDAGIRETVGLVGAPAAEVFAEVRRRKDSF
ncbi:hydroxyacylglutathione hydrolase [Breoghania sp.]|uniref:hydroxyacylglutathione hydrolase n=1 Tax=Breoghania sp. TaxID=2065378 RepID=UPI0026016F20|nr:hydroxyacylglutathione hydrolase [Breoghania sp.]MDJ0931440.1 hydroxyacylglutathione hydrolase [Breoghania sp.]